MTESEYGHLADATLKQLESALDAAGVDYERASDGVLEIEFDDDSVIVVNKQSAAQEIWVAAKRGGFHFRWATDAWRDTRSGEALFSVLSRLASEQSGVDVLLSEAEA